RGRRGRVGNRARIRGGRHAVGNGDNPVSAWGQVGQRAADLVAGEGSAGRSAADACYGQPRVHRVAEDDIVGIGRAAVVDGDGESVSASSCRHRRVGEVLDYGQQHVLNDPNGVAASVAVLI